MAFVGAFVGDLGATVGAGNVLLGERLGLYREPGAGSRRRALARGRDRHRPPLRRRVAAGPGRRRLRRARRRHRDVLDDPREGVRAHRPRRSGLPPGCVRARPRGAQGAARDRARLPHGGRLRLARARPGRLHRLRAVLPPGLPDAPAPRVDPRPRRGGRPARAGRPGRGPRVRSRRLDHPDGAGLPGQLVRRLRLPPRVDRGGARARGRRRGVGAGCASTSPAPSRSTSATSTWSRPSTACTTWATRSARPSTSVARSPPTAPG